ncbi:MAG TPA: energy transducer TonB [Polyangiaceae bacterium]|nr:energy transducer TonB [Polyangiaceae bacterium]
MHGAHAEMTLPSPPKARVEASARADRDPFAAVLSFGSHAANVGLVIGFAIATLSHGAFGGRVLLAPTAMRAWATDAIALVHDHLWATYDVEMLKPAEAPKQEPPKVEDKPAEKEPEAIPQQAAPQQAYEPPPPAAQAGKVLTANPDPSEPVDMTGNAFVQGDSDQYVGGVTAAAGTGSAATYNPSATTGPTATGTGTGGPPPPPPKPQGPDQSRPPGIVGGAAWSSCEFPPEADQDQVDYAVAVIVVTVRPDGSAQSVRVVSEPGHGFGRAARMCALTKRYTPALDRDGNPVVGTTPPINVTFTR